MLFLKHQPNFSPTPASGELARLCPRPKLGFEPCLQAPGHAHDLCQGRDAEQTPGMGFGARLWKSSSSLSSWEANAWIAAGWIQSKLSFSCLELFSLCRPRKACDFSFVLKRISPRLLKHSLRRLRGELCCRNPAQWEASAAWQGACSSDSTTEPPKAPAVPWKGNNCPRSTNLSLTIPYIPPEHSPDTSSFPSKELAHF